MLSKIKVFGLISSAFFLFNAVPASAYVSETNAINTATSFFKPYPYSRTIFNNRYNQWKIYECPASNPCWTFTGNTYRDIHRTGTDSVWVTIAWQESTVYLSPQQYCHDDWRGKVVPKGSRFTVNSSSHVQGPICS